VKVSARVATILFVVILSIALIAQTNQGSISGVVTDSTGAVVSQAQVTLLNTETGVSRALETNEAGEYVARNLPPGLYQVSVEASGLSASNAAESVSKWPSLSDSTPP
jgi:hypothetical protein